MHTGQPLLVLFKNLAFSTPKENAKYQGRVFRLTHKDSPLISRKIWDKVKRKKDIKTWSFKELIEDLGSNIHVWRVHSQDELVRRGKAIRDELIAAILSGKLNETQATWAIWAVGHIDRKNDNNEEEWNIEKFADDQWSLKGKTINTYKLNIRVQATRILGETEISTAAPKLIKLLSDEEPRIRLAAIGSLDRIGWGNNSDTIPVSYTHLTLPTSDLV